MKKPLNLPKFKNEDEEREYWAKTDLTDYFEHSDFESVSLPNLKPSTKTISLRLPESTLTQLKTLANKHDIPYQSMIKMFLAERLEFESRRQATE